MMSQAVPVWMCWPLGEEPKSHLGLCQKMPSELSKRPGHHRNRNPLPIFHQRGGFGGGCHSPAGWEGDTEPR